MKNISITSLISDGLQTRAAMNEDVVADYAEILAGGGTLPPVKVFFDGQAHFLADGFHRVAAARRAGLAQIAADVEGGTRLLALKYALKANAAHGLRRTNADKRRALEIAWENRADLFGGDPSNRELADLTGTSREFARIFIEEAKVTTVVTPGVSNSDGEDLDLEPDAPTVKTNLGHGYDRFSVPIPERLLPAFHMAELRKLQRTVRGLRQALAYQLEHANAAFAAVPQRTLITLDNAARDLKFALPYCVCRACTGEGCIRCGDRGFQTHLEYKQLPRERKAEKDR